MFQAKGGALAFIQGNQPSVQQSVSDSDSSKSLLVYIDGDHEYVVFDPYGNKEPESILARREAIPIEETSKHNFHLYALILC